jgi:hypothetical protein
MKLKIFGGLLVAALAITSMAQAQTRTPHINRVERRQDRRIAMDVRHGRINRAEAFHLRGDERRLNEQKRMAMADGRMNRYERRHLRNEQARIHHEIRRDERHRKFN